MTGVEIATIVSIGLNLILGWFTKKKHDRAKLLAPVIRGVEVGNIPQVKKAIQAAATAAGVQNLLHAEVKKLTQPQ